MYFPTIVLAASLALTAMAGPIDSTSTLETRDPDRDRRPETFRLNVVNKCKFTKQVALYQITKKFKMVQKSKPRNVPQDKPSFCGQFALRSYWKDAVTYNSSICPPQSLGAPLQGPGLVYESPYAA